MAQREIDSLRARILSDQKRASAKVSRLKRVNGAEIAGSEFDPRASRERIARMNRRQLNALSDRLQTFNSRKTQYYGGAQGSVFTARQKRQLETAQAQSNEARTAWYDRVKDMLGPGGRPLRERKENLTERKHPNRYAAVNDPFDALTRKLKYVNAKALDPLIAKLRDETRPGYEDRLAEKRREEYLQMVDLIEDNDLRTAIQGLTPAQFGRMWYLTDFPDLISNTYEAFKSGEDDQLQDPLSQLSQEIEAARNVIEWAKTTPE